MKRIDLDDLPPRIAQVLAGLEGDEELLLVQGGALAGRLRRADTPAPTAASDPPAEAEMKDILDHFNTIIHDEF